MWGVKNVIARRELLRREGGAFCVKVVVTIPVTVAVTDAAVEGGTTNHCVGRTPSGQGNDVTLRLHYQPPASTPDNIQASGTQTAGETPFKHK